MTIIVSIMARAGMQACALLAALLAATVSADAGAGAERLLRDPFARPAAAAVAAAPQAAAGVDSAAAPAPPPWLPELRAVMYDPAPGHSLVNISGAVLAPGESVRGYRVVKINERSVVVARDGVRLTLTLDNREAPQ